MKKTEIGILFIGNSFTGRNDLPGLLTEMTASASQPKTLITQQVLANGASLRQHWNAGTAFAAIQSGGWDYVVLQEQSTLPIKNVNRFHENVRLFAEEIQKSGARIVLYLTWARQHAPETQAALTDGTRAIADEIGALVVPVGVVWERALKENPELPLYDKDGSHPSALGSYLAACVFYTTLFSESPVGLAVPGRLKISVDDAATVQTIANRQIT